MCWVLRFAPCKAAAPSPTTMKRTPRRLSAPSSRSSPSVKPEESSTRERLLQPFARSLLQVAERVVEAAHIHTRVTLGDSLCALPEAFARFDPGALFEGELVAILHPGKVARG